MEYDILKLIGSTKPTKYMGETELQSKKVLFNGIKTIGKFCHRDLEHAKRRTQASHNAPGYLFREKYLEHKYNRKKYVSSKLKKLRF